MDAEAMCGAGGDESAARGAAEFVDATQEAIEVGEAGDEGSTQGLVVGPPGLTIRLPTSVWGTV
jgi:hypothetical protein